jgi:hypothetical protein
MTFPGRKGATNATSPMIDSLQLSRRGELYDGTEEDTST